MIASIKANAALNSCHSFPDAHFAKPKASRAVPRSSQAGEGTLAHQTRALSEGSTSSEAHRGHYLWLGEYLGHLLGNEAMISNGGLEHFKIIPE